MGAEVDAARGEVVAATTHTDATGHFRLRLRPGDYTVIARNAGGYRSSAQAAARVTAGGVTTVALTVDSGIR